MRKNKKLSLSLLVGLTVLIAFIAFIFYQSSQPLAVNLDVRDKFYIQDNKNVLLSNWKNRAYEGDNSNYFYYLSEQELMEKSQLTLQTQEVERANDLFFSKQYGLVDYKNEEIHLDNQAYPYQDQGPDSDSLRRYYFSNQEGPISSENLTAFVTRGEVQYRERNQPLWQATWWAAGLYILFFLIAIAILFNLEAVSISFVQLFISDAQPGPIVKFSFGLTALLLIGSGFMLLVSVISSI